MSLTTTAAIQMEPFLGEVGRNVNEVIERLHEAAGHGAQLAVFPECVLSGYCFSSKDEASPFALDTSSPEMRSIADACRTLGLTVVIGFLERDGAKLYNSAALIFSGEIRAVYRKAHLPCLGVDRFVSPGNALDVFETPVGRIGMIICYDLRFPEAARTLALKGADIICLPTNWPIGAESSAEHIAATRAWENRVFLVAVNRVGAERGFRFIGRSRIVGPDGELASAEHDQRAVLYAEFNPTAARDKQVVRIPGEYEMNPVAHRRPDLYGVLTDTHG